MYFYFMGKTGRRLLARSNVSCEDLGLIARAKAGEQRAWDVLFKKHRGLCCKAINDLRLIMTDERLQNARLGLWHAVNHYDVSRGTFSTYAMAIIKGYVLNGDRPSVSERHFVESKRVSFWDNKDEPREFACTPNEEKGFEDTEERARLIETLCEGLSRRKACIVRGRVTGKSLRQIGQELKISPERVRQIWAGILGRCAKLYCVARSS
jgi:RNA polymerase sigma factor (sigma-70 family)